MAWSFDCGHCKIQVGVTHDLCPIIAPVLIIVLQSMMKVDSRAISIVRVLWSTTSFIGRLLESGDRCYLVWSTRYGAPDIFGYVFAEQTKLHCPSIISHDDKCNDNFNHIYQPLNAGVYTCTIMYIHKIM